MAALARWWGRARLARQRRFDSIHPNRPIVAIPPRCELARTRAGRRFLRLLNKFRRTS